MAKFRRRNTPRSFNAAPNRTLRPGIGRKPFVHGRQNSFHRDAEYRNLVARPPRKAAATGSSQHLQSDPIALGAGVNQPVELLVSADRHRSLPRTMEKLAGGQQLRVVVLGDSIVNDTFRMRGPGWGAIGKHYDSRITVVKSVRGSCGAWWYKEENRVEEYVLAHQPDLVMIGGISNADDLESMRAVVEQIQQANPEIEIVLMSAGANLRSVPAQPALKLDSRSLSWRGQLMRLAEEMQVGFIDFEGSYKQFVYAAHQSNPSVDHRYFQRDSAHTNRRGELLLGAILSTFFIGAPCKDATRLSTADIAHSVTLWTARRCKALLRGQFRLPEPVAPQTTGQTALAN